MLCRVRFANPTKRTWHGTYVILGALCWFANSLYSVCSRLPTAGRYIPELVEGDTPDIRQNPLNANRRQNCSLILELRAVPVYRAQKVR